MSDGFVGFALYVAFVFMAGLWLGIKWEAHRWRDNASRIQRIESNGRLFKVRHDDTQPTPNV